MSHTRTVVCALLWWINLVLPYFAFHVEQNTNAVPRFRPTHHQKTAIAGDVVLRSEEIRALGHREWRVEENSRRGNATRAGVNGGPHDAVGIPIIKLASVARP